MRPLEKLDGTLVLLGRFASLERAEISAFAGFRVWFPGIETEFPAFEFSNHAAETAAIVPMSEPQRGTISPLRQRLPPMKNLQGPAGGPRSSLARYSGFSS